MIMTQSVGRPGQPLPSRSSGGFGSFTHSPGHAVLGYEADPCSPPSPPHAPCTLFCFPVRLLMLLFLPRKTCPILCVLGKLIFHQRPSSSPGAYRCANPHPPAPVPESSGAVPSVVMSKPFSSTGWRLIHVCSPGPCRLRPLWIQAPLSVARLPRGARVLAQSKH